jgi:hypothetical protein
MLMLMHNLTIQNLKSADEVWDILEKTRGGVYTRKLRLRRELHHSVMSGGESVQMYVARIRRICADLLAVGVTVSNDEVVSAPLAGLPAAYGMVVTVIESSEEGLTVAAVVTTLLNTEARVAREETAEAHVAAPPRFTPHTETRTCHYCGKPGRLQHDCRARIRAEQNGSQAKALMAGLGVSSSTVWLIEALLRSINTWAQSDVTLFESAGVRTSVYVTIMIPNLGPSSVGKGGAEAAR